MQGSILNPLDAVSYTERSKIYILMLNNQYHNVLFMTEEQWYVNVVSLFVVALFTRQFVRGGVFCLRAPCRPPPSSALVLLPLFYSVNSYYMSPKDSGVCVWWVFEVDV